MSDLQASGATLRRLYEQKRMSMREISEEFDVSVYRVRKAFDEHDIEARPSKKEATGPWQDKETLQSLYDERGLRSREVAERLGCDHSTVCRWLDNHGITKQPANNQFGYAPHKLDRDGYPVWRTYVDGTRHRVSIHRLLAVSEYGFDAVSGNVVHHKNKCTFDNRPSNIQILDHAEHSRLHGREDAQKQRDLMLSLQASGVIDPSEAARSKGVEDAG